jgi:hypothetical protein
MTLLRVRREGWRQGEFAVGTRPTFPLTKGSHHLNSGCGSPGIHGPKGLRCSVKVVLQQQPHRFVFADDTGVDAFVAALLFRQENVPTSRALSGFAMGPRNGESFVPQRLHGIKLHRTTGRSERSRQRNQSQHSHGYCDCPRITRTHTVQQTRHCMRQHQGGY